MQKHRTLKDLFKFHDPTWDHPDYVSATNTVLLTLALTATGILTSRFYSDWMIFARCGCLITAFGLLATIRRLKRVINLEQRRARLAVMHEISLVQPLMEKEVKAQEREGELHMGLTKSAERLESGCLLLGTLIWGFGDLAGKIWK